MNLSIVQPVESNLPAIQNVFYKTWLATYPNAELGITEEDIHDRFKNALAPEVLAKRWERIKHEQEHPETGQMLVAKVTDAGTDIIVGLGRSVRHADKNQLQAIYVLPEYQHQGIGTMLWQALCKSFDVSMPTIVAVATYNKQAIAFYEKIGFTDTGKRWQDDKFKMKSGAVIPEMEMVIKEPKDL